MKRLLAAIAVVLLASTAFAIGTPSNPTKIQIEVFDRGEAPEGKGTIVDNRWTRWIHDEALKAGFDVSYVACPRSQEVEKLNLWMASNQAPDIVLTYDSNLFSSYAEMGGIWALDEYIDKYGPAIKREMGYLLPMLTIDGKIYGLTSRRGSPPQIAPMKIRQDWLDVLGLKQPTTVQELYTALKAFKEKDPGKIGSDKVVPFAIPSPGVVGKPGFYLDIMFGFGVRNDVPGFPTMPGGNYDANTGVFRSPVDLPEARNFYRWMNQLYKEGLLPKEFAIDMNGEAFTRYVSSGAAGFINTNEPDMNPVTIGAVPSVNWRPIEPLKAPDGSRIVATNKKSTFGWYIMVPKFRKNPEEVVRFIDWFIEKRISDTINDGFEGEHFKWVDGVKAEIDAAYNKKDMFSKGDMNLIGSLGLTILPDDKLHLKYKDKRQVEILTFARRMAAEFGSDLYLNFAAYPRPVANDKGPQLKKHMFDGAAKVIVAKDFESEYDKYVDGWKKLGGEEYDNELAGILKKLLK